jgi:hypothetical protein
MLNASMIWEKPRNNAKLVSQRVAESVPPEGVRFAELGELRVEGVRPSVRLLGESARLAIRSRHRCPRPL